MEPEHREVDLSESSVYGKDEAMPAVGGADVASEATLDRLEAMTGGEDVAAGGTDEPATFDDLALDREMAKADAGYDEELDALQVNLMQDDNVPDARDGSGRVIDDTAEERLAEITETGPMLDGEGADVYTPGRDDTSAVLAEHHPNTEIARAETVIEGQVDETRDERKVDAKVDEGTGS